MNGFIAQRGFTRNSRSEQRIFVNARPVESTPVYRAIKEACGPMLERGRFQPALIFLTMPPGSVDVNVHPTKREVRFRNEFDVVAAVRTAVSSALRSNDAVIPVTMEGVSDPAETSARLFPDFAPDMQNTSPSTDTEPPKTPPVGAPATGLVTSVESLLESARVGYRVIGSVVRAPFPQARPDGFAPPPDKDTPLPFPADKPANNNLSEPPPDFRLVAAAQAQHRVEASCQLPRGAQSWLMG